MVLLIVVMILNVAFANKSETLANPVPLQEPRAAVIPYRVTGMPVMINTAVAENRSTDSWLAYSITNKSQERIERLELQVFIIDGNGKLVSIEEGSSGKGISPGVTQEDRTRIAKPIEHSSMSIVTVSKAVGQSGVWSIDLSQLKRAVANRLSGRGSELVTVAFEPHAKITVTDRAEIFKLILDKFLSDDAMAERLKDRTNVLVDGEGVEFDIPEIQSVKITKLDKGEIERIANEKGRIVYLIYRPFAIEGVRVMARISIRDQVAQRPGVYVPYKFTYLFICVSRDGRRTIEKSLGYAES